ncbi:MAG: OmpA family protein [Thermodesulfovibrionales bacterium]|nr:OmpA family protein [Thermodesulfovibrionales bacterium]
MSNKISPTKRGFLYRKSDDGEHIWLITMSDFLTLLLVCFIMFFMMSKGGGKDLILQERQQITDDKKNLLETKSANKIKTVIDEINSTITSMNLKDEISAISTNNEIVITLKEKVVFRPAEARLLNSAYEPLNKIAGIIKEHQEFAVEIEGHTDNIPINNKFFASNWELSMARAITVLRYFTDNEGISPSRFSIKGNGEFRPVNSNTTPEERSQNRRVEVRLRLPNG